jgi:CRISPR-associated protein Csy3
MALKKLPGVNSYSRTQVISDGRFFCLDENAVETNLNVIRHGIRGTQNINKTGDYDVSQIQLTETARTNSDTVAFGVEFSLRFLPLSSALHSCAGKGADQLREEFHMFTGKAENSEGLKEVGRRFARNILNGRWLWRNRSIGNAIRVSVNAGRLEIADYDALSSSLNHFDSYTQEEIDLGDIIAMSLSGGDAQGISIRAVVDLGFKGSVEVFPSQNYVERKPKGFARPLYKMGLADPVKQNKDAGANDYNDVRRMGVAALRDQKIGNALRTIDTWYPEAADNDYRPIAVEPVGANLDLMTFFRSKKDKSTSFDIALRMGDLDPCSEDGMFMIAALMRGGVYGESDKAE